MLIQERGVKEMQIYIFFFDDRPIPLIPPSIIDSLLTGIQNEVKRNEKTKTIFIPWMQRLMRAKQVYHSFAHIIADIIERKELGIVFLCGDSYGSLSSYKQLGPSVEAVKDRYSPVALPYVVRQSEIGGYGEHSQAYCYASPVLSSQLCGELFKWFWDHILPQGGSLVKPVTYAKHLTLRDNRGEMPKRWQPGKHNYPNAIGYESYLNDSYYYEAYLEAIIGHFKSFSRPSIDGVHFYYGLGVRKAVEEALFFNKWKEKMKNLFSCKKTEHILIGDGQ